MKVVKKQASAVYVLELNAVIVSLNLSDESSSEENDYQRVVDHYASPILDLEGREDFRTKLIRVRDR